ncbi:hypothetical protein KIN20_004409 [Parelaphostrongylus tenuis]|uniref:Uncharacterized protein n=1 Tax=Parelaphostrongylus tenuis TaxID=148309 RepID=A0AAD5MJR5_PARTN|nr:hypothetical protein KIN20_004409 [Parelaphostrongylus tenuis]
MSGTCYNGLATWWKYTVSLSPMRSYFCSLLHSEHFFLSRKMFHTSAHLLVVWSVGAGRGSIRPSAIDRSIALARLTDLLQRLAKQRFACTFNQAEQERYQEKHTDLEDYNRMETREKS